MQHLWSWNLVPSWPIMFGNSVSRAYHDFPRHGSYTCPGTFNRSPFGIQYPKLVCTLRKFQEGRRVTGPFCWACAQGRYGPGPKACMGLGSRCRTVPFSSIDTFSFNRHIFGQQTYFHSIRTLNIYIYIYIYLIWKDMTFHYAFFDISNLKGYDI